MSSYGARNPTESALLPQQARLRTFWQIFELGRQVQQGGLATISYSQNDVKCLLARCVINGVQIQGADGSCVDTLQASEGTC